MSDSELRRVHALDWPRVQAELDAYGCARLPKLLTARECAATSALYRVERKFRSRVVMARHGFGRGEYRYFAYPLPPLVKALRSSFYPHLAPLANRWYERMRLGVRFPEGHEAFIERCHRAGQVHPTPLLLKYAAGDYNCLHQDLYGEHLFPLQIAVLLSQPGEDFEGGEFVLTEQRPRMQSRAEVVPLHRGDAVVFAVNDRPVAGARGDYRVKFRHGVSRIRSGHRQTLGIIFHDAG
jgi:uncharacterized protein